MLTLLTHHTTFLALIAVVVLLNITILWATASIGKSYPSVDSVIGQNIGCQINHDHEKEYCCSCPHHSHWDFPGMRCMDCYGKPCDEGSRQ